MTCTSFLFGNMFQCFTHASSCPCKVLSMQHFVHATICPCDILSIRLLVRATFCPCNHLSATICPQRFVRDDMSATFCPATICPATICPCDDVSATICPRRFVMRQSVRSPPHPKFFFGATFAVFLPINLKKKPSKQKNRTLLSCSAGFWLHFKTSPSLLVFEMAEKFGKRQHSHFDP